jgi:hypothetical protein
MPQARLKDFEQASAKRGIVAWLDAKADRLQVTATALQWPLAALQWLDAARAGEISDDTGSTITLHD